MQHLMVEVVPSDAKFVNGKFEKEFRRTPRSQGYLVVLQPKASAFEEPPVHPNSDQRLYVIAGTGEAEVNGEIVRIHKGSMLLIEAGEVHKVTNTGNEDLVTVNVFAPPAFD